MEKTIISYHEFGCIRHAWVSIPGRSSVCVGRQGELETTIIDRAIIHWQRHDAYKIIEDAMRAKHPEQQLYTSMLPQPDVIWDGQEGYYLYCLKDRRKAGKYQVLDAVLL